MSPQPPQSLRPTPLHFFEEMFEPFIHQSRNITIQYQIQTGTNKKTDDLAIVVCSVNEAETTDDFIRKLTALTDKSLQKLDMFFQQQNAAHIDAFVDYMLGKLDALSLIVVDEPFLIMDEQEASYRHEMIKSFVQPRLVGPKIGEWKILGPSICYQTQKFAKAWLRVIHDTKDQVNLIRSMHKNSWLANSTMTLPVNPEKKKYKIALNISIDQQAYLFYFLSKTGIIDIPYRKTPEFIDWMTDNIQSKNCESNTTKSSRNKFFSHELSTLDFWDEKFQIGRESIEKEREQKLK
jgi:hypothetical protein